MQGCNYRRCNASGPHNEGPSIATFYCKIFSLKAQVNLLLLNVILELLVASQQFSRRSPIKRDLPPASKYNRKICSKMITSIIRYHTPIHYIMSITHDRFRPYWVSSGRCKKHSIINMLKNKFAIRCQKKMQCKTI